MKNHVNLLPWKYRRAGLLKTLLPRWCAVWTIGIGTFVAVFCLNEAHHARTLSILSAHETECRPITTMAKENAQMLREVRHFDNRETLVGQLREEEPVLCLLAAVSKSAQACEGRIVIRDLHFEHQAVRQTQADAPPQAVLSLEGDALDNLAIARFAAGLRDAAIFQDVILESSVGKPTADRSVHSFVIRCEM